MYNSNLLSKVPDRDKLQILDQIFVHYVEKQGLGAIPKADLDALIVYMYAKHAMNDDFNAFELGRKFLLKESRVKSLYETGLIKYAELSPGSAWISILSKLRGTKFELESFEKAHIKFKFENPALYKYLQNTVREIGGTAPYSPTYETVTIQLSTFFELLDHIYVVSQSEYAATETDEIRPLIEKTVIQVGKSLGKKKMRKLAGKEAIATKAGKALQAANTMSGIGTAVGTMIAAL